MLVNMFGGISIPEGQSLALLARTDLTLYVRLYLNLPWHFAHGGMFVAISCF